jgi:hypothetical protein
MAGQGSAPALLKPLEACETGRARQAPYQNPQPSARLENRRGTPRRLPEPIPLRSRRHGLSRFRAQLASSVISASAKTKALAVRSEPL